MTFFIAVKAHEEPSKTLKEKKDKEQKKAQIVKSKIKTATVWKFVFEKDTETKIKNRAFVMGYDKQGNLSFIEAYKNDSLNERDEYTYSASGEMLSETDLLKGTEVIEKNNFIYDKENLLTSGICKNKNDSIIGRFSIIRNKDKKSLEYFNYSANDSLDYKLVYEYPDSFDRQEYTEAKKTDNEGKLIIRVTKDYNSDGLPIKKVIFDNNDKLSYYFIYEYDKAGNNVRITKNLADGTIEWEDHYFYDKNGNCTELKSYDKNKTMKAHLLYEFEHYK
jgi:hypothetical protein